MQIFSIIFFILFVLFLPGFVLSFIFFKKRKLDAIERLTLSFALSIAVVPLTVFYTNLLGISITMVTVILQITLVLLIAVAILLYKKIRKKE